MTTKGIGLLVLAGAMCLHAKETEAQRMDAAATTLTDLAGTPDKGIPAELLKKADCLVVVPGLKKGGFMIAGQFGRGYAFCRLANGWSAPLAMRMEGGSVGFQAGGQSADVVLLVMNEAGMKRLAGSKFTLGGEASIAAGPVGRDAQAMTDATMKAEILAYSKAQGVFGGVSLKGSTLRPDDDANKKMYGKEVAPMDVLSGKTKLPPESKAILDKLVQYAGTVKTK